MKFSDNFDNVIKSLYRLYSLAYNDQLTGAPNRQKLKDDFNDLAQKVKNDKIRGIIALFDVDHFKQVNDTYGHNVGDIVLCRLVERIECEPSFSGHLYRLGGDEFVFLFSDPKSKFISDEECREYYREVLSLALLDYTLPEIDLSCTVSIGVSLFPEQGSTLSEVLRRADIALYRAKEAGRNRIVFFEECDN